MTFLSSVVFGFVMTSVVVGTLIGFALLGDKMQANGGGVVSGMLIAASIIACILIAYVSE